MKLNLIDIIGNSEQIKNWLEHRDTPHQLLTGLAGSAKTLAMIELYKKTNKQILVITPNLYYANQLVEDLQNLLNFEEVYSFPVNEVITAEMAFSSPEFRSERIRTLDALTQKRAGIFVVPVAGIRKMLPTVSVWQSSTLTFSKGQEVQVEELPKKMYEMGYERQQMVGRPGEFSLRGSIVDIYPLNSEYPVRLDFFDVELDSIRYFEADTQRSIRTVEHIEILPATELVISEKNFQTGISTMANALEKHLAVITEKETKTFIEEYFQSIMESWQKGIPTEFSRYYTDFLYQKNTSLLHYLEPDGFVLIDDYSRIVEAEKEMLREEGEWIVQKLEEQRVFPNQVFGNDVRKELKQIKQPMTFFSIFQKGMGNWRFQQVYNFHYRSMQQFFGQLPLLKVEMDRWQKQGHTILILVENKDRRRKLENIFQDYTIRSIVSDADKLVIGETQIIQGSLQTGFELPVEKITVLTEKEIFHTSNKKKRARRQTISNAERLKSYNELKAGDYVVHANHGIGKYIGMETLEIDGIHQDYITIVYKNDDKLFIPVTQLNLIQKYVASEAKTPHINKLGGSEWGKTKRKVSSKIEDIADELIQLYAQREAETGFSFSPDDAYQKEFEEAFPYTETEDQLRSTAEIKRDMEKQKPMDRLLVGDVGYGKTEVALRAAFKAIQDNKQVAFLVPTTILAQQHYETMLERFSGFPVTVGLLSRFRSTKQQNETLQELKKGQIDIVVGTHRLLSKDVEFQDLGLLLIDEEQRFGVKHKERLKQLRAEVDVLTLTATPIPRTLHMSMLGVRDLSVIETPPADRYPVQTYVMEKNMGAIREAIEREMARQGQVFYLYNRVDTIVQRAEELQALVPDARIGFAHGQMSEIQLENVLYDFIEGQYDVLVTTTIIETGVDIPNANTLFVENADYMGLSTLYQLRGRVGRSNRVAYAYFMYEPQKVLNEVSEKRLQAVKDFTELGSGFKIAMRDLSIRGAGNLLGAQQHGFIDAVGFDMYSQMLTEAVARKQGTETQELKTSVELDVSIDAYLPNEYIEDERQKIEIYKRIRQIENKEMYEEIESDLLDRFGEYPEEVAHLLSVGLLKMESDLAMLEKIWREESILFVKLSKLGTKMYTVEQIFEALSATKLKAQLGMSEDQMMIQLKIDRDSTEVEIWLQELIQFVSALRQLKYQKDGE